jgi:TonB family protein
MRATSILEKSVIFVAAVAVNLGLYLLVPYIQVLIQKHNPGPKSPRQVVTELNFAPPPAEKLVKREIKEIKTRSIDPPQPNPSRPTTPGGGLKIDLSVAGGEGQALLSGGDRTGSIGSGTGGGKGEGMAAMTYDVGQTDEDARPINSPPLIPPPRAQREGISGVVELTFTVTEFGIAQSIAILKEEPTGYGFGKAAIESAKKIRFKPAKLQKIAVRQYVKQTFRFDLE